jgi:hypothetical protein
MERQRIVLRYRNMTIKVEQPYRLEAPHGSLKTTVWKRPSVGTHETLQHLILVWKIWCSSPRSFSRFREIWRCMVAFGEKEAFSEGRVTDGSLWMSLPSTKNYTSQ